jgi:aryl-alcohol dehydrogenase-like predicted oxidoreductase
VFGWTIGEQQSFEILDAWLAAGFNFIDTADSYSNWIPGNKGGESETIIGNWTKKQGNRNGIIISTKLGSEMGPGKKGLSKKYIIEAVDASLLRLQTHYIDLYQAHWPDPSTPHEESLEAYSRLLIEGKVRAIGASNFSAQQLTDALEAGRKNNLPSYTTLQPLYNLYDRAVFENELERICLDNNIGVINYSALARGFLTGKYRGESDFSKSAKGEGVKKYLTDRGLQILKALDEVAARYDSTPASVSIAWLLTRPAVSSPIASVTSIEQLKGLSEAVKLQLDKDAVELLNEASEE